MVLRSLFFVCLVFGFFLVVRIIYTDYRKIRKYHKKKVKITYNLTTMYRILSQKVNMSPFTLLPMGGLIFWWKEEKHITHNKHNN